MAVENPTIEPEVGVVVRLLMVAAHKDQEEIAQVLGISRPAVTMRVNGATQWKARELQALAAYFDVSPAVFFTAPMDLFRQSRNLGYKETAGQRADLSLVHGSGKGNPVRQSPLMLGYASAAAAGD